MAKVIMTVDDSPSITKVVMMTLKGAGYDVIDAKDGRDALAKMKTTSIHMLITDLNMPIMDGITLIRQVRADEKYKWIPIIMLTTESQDSKKQEGKAAGASGWIVKPFTPEQLIAVVKKVLK
ncbi:Chemotaxis protein CheY1 [Azospirillaceae bacterium]